MMRQIIVLRLWKCTDTVQRCIFKIRDRTLARISRAIHNIHTRLQINIAVMKFSKIF